MDLFLHHTRLLRLLFHHFLCFALIHLLHCNSYFPMQSTETQRNYSMALRQINANIYFMSNYWSTEAVQCSSYESNHPFRNGCAKPLWEEQPAGASRARNMTTRTGYRFPTEWATGSTRGWIFHKADGNPVDRYLQSFFSPPPYMLQCCYCS